MDITKLLRKIRDPHSPQLDGAVGSEPNASGPSLYVYLWDRNSNWLWMRSHDRGDFARIAGVARTPLDAERLRAAVAHLLSPMSSGDVVAEWDGMDANAQMTVLFNAYIGTTRSWAATDGMLQGGHFVVINYRSNKTPGGCLRPFAVPLAEDGVLPVPTLMGYVRQILQQDRQAHPDWFD